MSLIQTAKAAAERITGLRRPAERDLGALVRVRKANAFRFAGDDLVPNHPAWPLIVYRTPVRLPAEFDPAAVLEGLFELNGWGGTWRDGIYGYTHYHSRIHEVLGVARGYGKVRFGGEGGRALTLKAGDVAVLPAGTGHRRLAASADFLVVGAYPPSGTYDECTKPEERPAALAAIPKVPRPAKDPIYGGDGPLVSRWVSG